MPIWGILLIAICAVFIICGLYILYCMLSSSEKKSAKIVSAIIGKGFYLILAIMMLFCFGYYLQSCSSEAYDRGYEAGYEAGIDAGISLVKEDPAAYLNW